MMAGAGGAMRATGWRATAIRFQQFGEGGPAFTISLTHSRARGADDGGRRRRDASYGVARDSHPVSTTAVRGLPAYIMFAALTRAREAPPIPASCETELRRADRPARAGAAAAGRRRHLRFSGLLFADFGATMELGRSGRSMMMSAGAGGRAQPATGSSQQIGKSAALTVGARVHHLSHPPARARR